MIRFYFNTAPNPVKVALMLEELGQPYEAIPVDTAKGEQHAPAFRAINPNGKVPAIVDTEGPGGREARVFDSNAILLYLAEKTGRFIGAPADRPDLLSWLFFIATGLGPFSGQAVHFQRAAPEKVPYAVNRYRREVERHYRVLDKHLAGREHIVGADYSIVDMSRLGLAHARPDRAAGRRTIRSPPSRTSNDWSRWSTPARLRRGRKRSGRIIRSSGRWTRTRSARCSRPTIRKSRCS